MNLQSALIVVGIILLVAVYLLSRWAEKSKSIASAGLDSHSFDVYGRDEPSLLSPDETDIQGNSIPTLDSPLSPELETTDSHQSRGDNFAEEVEGDPVESVDEPPDEHYEVLEDLVDPETGLDLTEPPVVDDEVPDDEADTLLLEEYPPLTETEALDVEEPVSDDVLTDESPASEESLIITAPLFPDESVRTSQDEIRDVDEESGNETELLINNRPAHDENDPMNVSDDTADDQLSQEPLDQESLHSASDPELDDHPEDENMAPTQDVGIDASPKPEGVAIEKVASDDGKKGLVQSDLLEPGADDFESDKKRTESDQVDEVEQDSKSSARDLVDASDLEVPVGKPNDESDSEILSDQLDSGVESAAEVVVEPEPTSISVAEPVEDQFDDTNDGSGLEVMSEPEPISEKEIVEEQTPERVAESQAEREPKPMALVEDVPERDTEPVLDLEPEFESKQDAISGVEEDEEDELPGSNLFEDDDEEEEDQAPARNLFADVDEDEVDDKFRERELYELDASEQILLSEPRLDGIDPVTRNESDEDSLPAEEQDTIDDDEKPLSESPMAEEYMDSEQDETTGDTRESEVDDDLISREDLVDLVNDIDTTPMPNFDLRIEPDLLDVPPMARVKSEDGEPVGTTSGFQYPDIPGFDKVSQIDYWARISGERDVGRESVIAIYRDSAAKIGKPGRIYGMKIPEKDWCDLETQSEDARFGDIVVTIQLADQSGAVTTGELEKFSAMVEKIAEGTGREGTLMAPLESAVQQAQAISDFVQYYDSVFVVNIKPTETEYLEGGEINRVATQLGLERSDSQFFVRNKAMGKSKVCLYSLANMSESGIFDFDEIKDMRTRGVTFFTMPAVNRSPGAVFSEMVDSAKAFAARIKGEPIAPNHDDLAQEDVDQIRQSIEDVAREMESHGIAPGSDEAMRLF